MRPAFGFVLLAAALTGCGDSSVGAAPVVKVSTEQRADDTHKMATKTVTWLEKMPAADRQAAVDRAPKIKEILKGAESSSDLKSRVDALQVRL